MLGVASGTLDDLGPDFELASATVLPASVAFGAGLDRELIGGPTDALGPLGCTRFEHDTAHRDDQLFRRQPMAMHLGERCLGLTEQIVGLGRELQRQLPAAETGLRLVRRPAAWLTA